MTLDAFLALNLRDGDTFELRSLKTPFVHLARFRHRIDNAPTPTICCDWKVATAGAHIYEGEWHERGQFVLAEHELVRVVEKPRLKQEAGSCVQDLPPSRRLVQIWESWSGGECWHVGYYDHGSNWWFCLSTERVNGDPMPKGEFCSLSIGNIKAWKPLGSCKQSHE